MTSTFPRDADDHEPGFVVELNERLHGDFHTEVLTPHAQELTSRARLRNEQVSRFRYAPEALENLAYQGGMLFRLRERPLRRLLVPAFLIAQYVTATRLVRRRGIDIIHAHWLIRHGHRHC